MKLSSEDAEMEDIAYRGDKEDQSPSKRAIDELTSSNYTLRDRIAKSREGVMVIEKSTESSYRL